MKRIEKGFALLLALLMLCANLCTTTLASTNEVTIDPDAYEVKMPASSGASATNVTSVSLYDTNVSIVLKNVKATSGKTYKVSVDDSSDFTSMNKNAYSISYEEAETVQDWIISDLKVTGERGYLVLNIKEEGKNTTLYKTIIIGEAVKADSVSTDSSSTTTNDTTAPNLIIKTSSIGKQSVKAGDTFTLSLDVYATTSGYLTAKDVVVSVTSDEGTTVASGSSSYYVGDMTAGSTKTVTFPMKALNGFTGGVSKIAVSVGSTSNSSTTTISVPVVQPDRFEVTKVEVPEILMVGEEGMLSVVYINKGKNPAYNVSAKLECEGLTEALQEEYVGNVAAGTQESIDFDVSALEAGTVEGKVTIVYENVDGDEVSIEKEFSITVEEAFVDDGMWEDPGMYEEMPTEQHTSVWVFIVIGIAVIGTVVAIVVVSKKKKAKKLLLEESLNDDEDI